MGLTAFVWLAIFALARLFAAVGLWIKASWGGVLLVGATGVELALYLSGSRDVQMSLFGFVVRVILLASIALVLLLGFRMKRAAARD
jgi:ABC-type transport system involved in cytochrome c biogenesis permease subunit